MTDIKDTPAALSECPCCGAPCEVTKTPAWDHRWTDENGQPQRTHHHAIERFTYRSGQLVPVPSVESFQSGVDAWMDACFGATIKSDRLERCDRFIEEALELCQTEPTFTADRAHALVDYVFGRPVGEPQQEVGGVMVTLAALCNTAAIDMNGAGATELARVWTKVEAIRAKQAAKPTGSALPIAAMKGEGRGDG